MINHPELNTEATRNANATMHVNDTRIDMTAMAAPVFEAKEIKKESWIKRLFSKKRDSRLFRIFKRRGKEYGIENRYDDKKREQLEMLHQRIDAEIETYEFAKNHPAYKEYVAVMKFIDGYTQAGDIASETDAINKSMALIDAFREKYSDNVDEITDEFTNRLLNFKLMFETKTNGSLAEPEQTVRITDDEIATQGYASWESAKDKVLFSHEPSPTDIQQRATEDCYMMSSLSSLALMNPQAIKDAIRDNGDGTVTVRFYDQLPADSLFSNRTAADCQNGDVLDVNKVIELALGKVARGDIKAIKRVEAPAAEPSTTAEVNEDETSEMDEDLLASFEILEEDDMEDVGFKSLVDTNNERWLTEIAKRMADDVRIHAVLAGNAVVDDQTLQEVVTKMIEIIDGDYKTLEDDIRRSTDAVRTKMTAKNVTVEKSFTKIWGTNINVNAVDCLWVQMIEKAYAAAYTSDAKATANPGYAGISRGNSYNFLRAFTGDDRYTGEPISGSDDAIFENLTRRTMAKQVVTVATNETDERRVKALNARGIRAGHAYSVLGTFITEGTKFVAMRDPYGLFTSSYEMSGNEAVAQGKKVSTGGVSLSMGESKGIFYMEISDFAQTFTNFSGIMK